VRKYPLTKLETLIYLLVALALVALALAPRPALSLELIKTVPAGASVQLVIDGRVAQSQAIAPGTYRIVVEEVAAASMHDAARRRRHR
jgi:hypothetical protein